MEENKEVIVPEAFSDALFDRKLSEKQRRFVSFLVHSEGLKTATQCAIDAGYAPGSARVRASELQHPEKSPLTAKAIEMERRAVLDRYKCSQDRSLATLAR